MKHYLNKNEEAVMQILWQLEKAFLKEIAEEFPDPKPPYTTIASVVKKLEKNGLISFRSFGKTHRYFPILKKEEYSGPSLKNILHNYFGGSYEKLVSFFMKEEDLDIKELEKIYNNLKSKHPNDDGIY